MSDNPTGTAGDDLGIAPLGEALLLSVAEVEAACDDIDSGDYGERVTRFAADVRAQFGSTRSGPEATLGHSLVALGAVAAYRLRHYEGRMVQCAPLSLLLVMPEPWVAEQAIAVVRMPDERGLRFRVIAYGRLDEHDIEYCRWEFVIGVGTDGRQVIWAEDIDAP